MRALLLFAAFVALGACSSKATAPPPLDAGDGANRALGTTCSPTVSDPCEQPSDACSIAVCDPTSRVCVRVAVDAGPACSSGNPPPGPSCASGACDAAAEAGDGAIDGGHATDGGDAGPSDGSSDATDGASDGGESDAPADAPADAGDSGD